MKINFQTNSVFALLAEENSLKLTQIRIKPFNNLKYFIIYAEIPYLFTNPNWSKIFTENQQFTIYSKIFFKKFAVFWCTENTKE